MEFAKEKRIFLDSVMMNAMCKIMTDDELKDEIDRYIEEDYQFVATETILDVPVFQNDWMWLDNRMSPIADRRIVVELWNSVEDMVNKCFYWSSADCEAIGKAKDVKLEEYIKDTLPDNWGGILEVLQTLKDFAIPRGQWKQGKAFSIKNARSDILKSLAFEHNDRFLTRSEAFLRSQTYGMMDLFEEFNDWYVRGIAEQHNCGSFLNANCKIIRL